MDDLMARMADSLRTLLDMEDPRMSGAERDSAHDALAEYDARPSGNSQEGWMLKREAAHLRIENAELRYALECAQEDARRLPGGDCLLVAHGGPAPCEAIICTHTDMDAAVKQLKSSGIKHEAMTYYLLAAAPTAAPPQLIDGSSFDWIEDAITAAVRDVAELPDRTSPADFPDGLIVTQQELTEILRSRFDPTAAPAEAFGKSDLGEAGASVSTETPSVEESETDRMGRSMDESDRKKAAEIARLRIEINDRQKRLRYLEESPCANN